MSTSQIAQIKANIDRQKDRIRLANPTGGSVRVGSVQAGIIASAESEIHAGRLALAKCAGWPALAKALGCSQHELDQVLVTYEQHKANAVI